MTTKQIADELFELVQRFVHVRPRLVVPEYVTRFREQIHNMNLNSINDPQDRAFIFRIFIVLTRSEAPPTMGELSSELGIPLSTATRIIDELVSVNFIERINDPNDRRIVRVQMTETGQQLYQSVMEFNKQRIIHILDKFSAEEQEQLLHLMTKLFDFLMVESY